jgi:hypothetical protein
MLFLFPSNKNVDIKFSVYDALLEKLSSGRLTAKILQNQINSTYLGAGKPGALYKIAKSYKVTHEWGRSTLVLEYFNWG